MNYFTPEKRYYIISIFEFNFNIKINDDVYFAQYVNEKFPVLRELAREKDSMLVKGKLPKESVEKYNEHKKLMLEVLEYLNLPSYVLVVGKGSKYVEPATGTKVGNMVSLGFHQISNLELEDYWIYNYDKKIKNFFNPDVTTLEAAQMSKKDFIELLNERSKENMDRKILVNKLANR